MQFDESKHKRDSDGKFAKQDGARTSDKEKRTKLERKFNDDLPVKPKNRYVDLPKKEYAQMCSAIRTRYTNKIPQKGGIYMGDYYYRFKYSKKQEHILCKAKLKIEGNEEKINEWDTKND